MRNSIVFTIVAGLLGTAILIGSIERSATPRSPQPDVEVDTATPPVDAPRRPVVMEDPGIPHIGSVRVLNGCGIDNAANEVAEHLRSAGFDVKDVDNAPTWNYSHTIVASRTTDKRNAQKVAESLSTERVVIMRTGESMYDVVVYVGRDYKERLK